MNKKYIMQSLVVLSCIALSFVFNNQTSAQIYRFVNAKEVYVWSNPVVSNDNVLATLKLGDRVELLNNEGGWARVQINSIQGYVLNKYLSSVKPAPKSSTELKVLVCHGPDAYAYHRYRCHGLNRCTRAITEVTVSEAQRMDRAPCKICY